MSLIGRLRYHTAVDVAGTVALRWQRLSQERRWRHRDWKREHTAPPLMCSPKLKELISRHYLKGRYANGHGPVAWVTSGAPIEYLVALGYHVHYPENHAAMCGIGRTADDACREAGAQDAGGSVGCVKVEDTAGVVEDGPKIHITTVR